MEVYSIHNAHSNHSNQSPRNGKEFRASYVMGAHLQNPKNIPQISPTIKNQASNSQRSAPTSLQMSADVCRTAPAIARPLLSYRHHKLQATGGWQGTLCTASGEWHSSMHLNALWDQHFSHLFAICCTSMTPSHHCATFSHLSDRANEVLVKSAQKMEWKTNTN